MLTQYSDFLMTTKIEKVVSPQKWDVLIRIIDNADQTVGRRSSAVSTESTTTYGGRKTTASSQSAQELRYALLEELV